MLSRHSSIFGFRAKAPSPPKGQRSSGVHLPAVRWQLVGIPVATRALPQQPQLMPPEWSATQIVSGAR